MIASPTVAAIRQRLLYAGYEDVATPFRVAGVEFEFTAAMRGSAGRSLDLVLLVDTTTGEHGDRNATRVHQRIDALSRALDISGSRYVVTTVLAGASLAGDIEELAEICRVLYVETQSPDGTMGASGSALRLEDSISVLLPLTLPDVAADEEGVSTTIEKLTRSLPNNLDGAMLAALLDASEHGEAAVTHAVGAAIDGVLAAPSEVEE